MKSLIIVPLVILILLFQTSALANDTLPSLEKAFELPRTRTITLRDSGTQRLYEIHLQMPRYYSSDKKYPVVYMTDSPYTFPIVVGAARYPVNFKKMEDVMFVGISWEIGHRAGLSRQRDYTPTDKPAGFNDPSGEADQHLAFIRNDVIAYIEKKYNTDSNRRTYMGNSYGGLFGAYILLTAPETFNNYILGSPSLWWDDKYIFELESKTNNLTADVSANVYISVGADENPLGRNSKENMVGNSEDFYTKLKARNLRNLKLKLQIIESATHQTAFPTTAIQGLWWLFETKK